MRMTTTETCDVVVVGARSAGAATAMLLAAAGHDVQLVDRASFPSDTLSTHAIGLNGMVQLDRWGLLPKLLEAGTPPIRNLLVPAGRVRLVLGWTLGSAAVGLVLMIGAAVAGWSAGVAAGMAVSEAVLLAGLLGPALHESRSAAP